MNSSRFVFMSVVFVTALFMGCSKNEAAFTSLDRGPKLMAEAPLMAESRTRADSGEVAKLVSDTAGQAGSAEANRSEAGSDGRKLIYTASLTIAVPEVQDAAKKLETQLTAFKAYIASQDWYESSISYEIKVPVEHFHALLESLGSAGKIRRKTVQARDVTEYYYDLENRVKNKRILVERYQTYLRNAKNVEDLLNVERFLNDATTDLESLEGSFRGLVKQVEYATISLTLEPLVTTSTSSPTLGERLRNLFNSFSSFLQSAIVILIALIIYGIPLVLILALLWLLLFGRVGLVKKIFILVNRK
ncbi:DUF4349 domain-containing protein [Gracilinema caldarium]|uniref:DUF4349 domain-containing protein n=1 Tax=Gracilinema caldarium (strain ATCC 51460 / DSM 7334 / H1) TaxID=744872 RepID=F8F1G0_GRAC1|nr:DUF4349 domain-containing protein [Gracilinema caldarium]AEJ19013.1 hypothetical protein Spica_0859 [Gracilinema caldarium DSM 7334]